MITTLREGRGALAPNTHQEIPSQKLYTKIRGKPEGKKPPQTLGRKAEISLSLPGEPESYRDVTGAGDNLGLSQLWLF